MRPKSRIEKKSNTRVDLCGGTLDLWPISTLIEDSKTYNASLSCFTKVSYTKGDSLRVSVESPDFKENHSFGDTQKFLDHFDSKLSLLQESFKAFLSVYPNMNLLGDWSLKSESPAGSGLGGSSSLLISILKVLFELSDASVSESEMVTWAKNIETRVLKKPAGVQDYYPAVKPGLSRISFGPYGESRKVLSSDLLEFLNNHLLLIDSQIKHHSGSNNWDIFKKMIDGDETVKTALDELSKISNKLESVLNAKDMMGLKKLFDRELKARKKVSNSYFTKDLEEFCSNFEPIKDILSYKVCGAGGGGCVLVLCSASTKQSVSSLLKKLGLSVLPFELVSQND